MILDYLFNNTVNKSTISELYRFSPFSESKRDQYAGSVIQYGFIVLANIDTSKAHENYSQEDWLSYKEDVFYKLCELITLHGTDSFLADECAISLYKMTFMLTSDLKHLSINLFSTQLSSLLSQLNKQSGEANTQNYANAIWAWAKLNTVEPLPLFDPDQINHLVSCFQDQRSVAYTQSLSNVLWAIAKLNESGMLDVINTSDVHDLITTFHAKSSKANSQELANAVWAIAKLNESGLLFDINSFQVSTIITEFYSKSMYATRQAHANTLWAAAKLIESEQLAAVNATEINNFIANVHAQQTRATPQELSNTLWAIAKLIEINKFTFMNTSCINDLVVNLYAKRTKADTYSLTLAVWAVGIISTQANINTPEQLVSYAFYRVRNSIVKKEKNQIIMGIALLGLEESYDIEHYINACRPTSILQPHHIAPYLNGAISYQIEAFICGFFVDLLVLFPDGKKLVVEFDGIYHQTRTHKNFDSFRDNIISQQEIEIVRVQWNESNKIFFPTYSQPFEPVSIAPTKGLSPNSRIFVPTAILNMLPTDSPPRLATAPTKALSADSPVFAPMPPAKGPTADTHASVPAKTVRGLLINSNTFLSKASVKSSPHSPTTLPTTSVPELLVANPAITPSTHKTMPTKCSYAEKVERPAVPATSAAISAKTYAHVTGMFGKSAVPLSASTAPAKTPRTPTSSGCVT